MPKNLTKAQARQVQEIIDRARRDDGIPRTAQQSIPFQRMFPDGICRVSDKYYTKTIQYQDINYQLAQQEDKTAIFEEWCSFLNFFDSSIHFELSFMNMATDAEVFEKNIRIPYRNDNFNNVRSEYSQMLKMQLAQGNNGLTKTKYITFGIEAESMREAKPRLEHVQTNLMNNFKRLGVSARVLNGKERLQLMHAMFHMGDNDRFYFDWSWLAGSGLSVKDFISAPLFREQGQERTVSNSILCSSAAGGKENSMYFDATEFAARLSTLRKAQGMTQEEMAEALNISLEHLSKMERGKRKPSIDLIIAMACYFRVSTDYLLMGKDHDKVDSRTKLLDVVTQLTEIAKSL